MNPTFNPCVCDLDTPFEFGQLRRKPFNIG